MTASLESADFLNRYGEQYKDLRRSLYRLVDAITKLEIYALGAVAAVYAWLVKGGGPHLHWAAFFIPLPLVWLALYRAHSQFKRIGKIHEYLYDMEEVIFEDQKLRGWQHFVGRTDALVRSDYIFWAFLIFITLISPFFLSTDLQQKVGLARHEPPPSPCLNFGLAQFTSALSLTPTNSTQ